MNSTISGPKWKSHRKIITPTFHFKILEEFIDVFNSNGQTLCDKLNRERSGKGPFDVYQYINLYALDNICGKFKLANWKKVKKNMVSHTHLIFYVCSPFSETAMGIKIDAQVNAESTFVRAIKE